MVIKNVRLETVIGVTSKIPQNVMPEIAFAGKSNVGKSSLINALHTLFAHPSTPRNAIVLNLFFLKMLLPTQAYRKR